MTYPTISISGNVFPTQTLYKLTLASYTNLPWYFDANNATKVSDFLLRQGAAHTNEVVDAIPPADYETDFYEFLAWYNAFMGYRTYIFVATSKRTLHCDRLTAWASSEAVALAALEKTYGATHIIEGLDATSIAHYAGSINCSAL